MAEPQNGNTSGRSSSCGSSSSSSSSNGVSSGGGGVSGGVGGNLNDYHIYEEIGRGKHSVVYKGRLKKSIQYVAIKSVDKSQRNKLLNEVRVLCNLRHENVLWFHNWYETKNHLWLIVEYCTGGDLLTLLRQDQTLPENSIRQFGRDIVTGLQYVHWKASIHCDIKPSNVLINEFGVLKLCGFGLARPIPTLANTDKDKATQSKRGTPHYMSPELFHRDGVHSFASDFWAVGCVLYELATGKPPFYAKTLQELVAMILYQPPPPLPTTVISGRGGNWSTEFQDLLRGLLEKDQAKRITWPELLIHPFWQDCPLDSPPAPLPSQPMFDALVASPSANSSSSSSTVLNQQQSSIGSPKFGSPAPNVGRNTNATPAPSSFSSQPQTQLPPSSAASTFGMSNPDLLRNTVRSTHSIPASVVGAARPATTTASTLATATAPPSRGNSEVDMDELSKVAQRNLVTRREDNPDDDDNEDDIEDETESNPAFQRGTPNRGGDGSEGAGGGGGSKKNGNQTNFDQELDFADKPIEDEKDNESEDELLEDSLEGDDVDTDVTESDSEAVLAPSSSSTAAPSSSPSSVSSSKPSSASSVLLAPTERVHVDRSVAALNQSIRKSMALLTMQQTANAAAGIGAVAGAAIVTHGSNGNGSGPSVASHTLVSTRPQGPEPSPPSRPQPVTLPSAQYPPSSSSSSSSTSSTSSSSSSSAASSSSAPSAPSSLPSPHPSSSTFPPSKQMSLDELLIHPSDIAVKPLVGNVRIEKLPLPKFDPKALSFRPMELSEILACGQSELETFLTLVYKSINGQGPVTERVNALIYFETLCTDTQVANMIINSSLMTLFVRLCRAFKTPNLKVHVVSVMGLLVRYATFIADALSQSNIVQVLSELLRDKNTKVRRRATATLGELLFYIATQQEQLYEQQNQTQSAEQQKAALNNLNTDDDASDPLVGEIEGPWKVSKFTIQMVRRCLRAGEDDIVRHYAAKLIENIGAQSHFFTAKWFCSTEVLYELLNIYNTSRNDHLRITCASALSHLLRRRPALYATFLDKVGIVWLRSGLEENAPRLQQSLLNILNGALVSNAPRLIPLIDGDLKRVMTTLLKLVSEVGGSGGAGGAGGAGGGGGGGGTVSGPASVLRGKTYLALAGFAALQLRWLLVGCELKLVQYVERAAKDRDHYLIQCLNTFVLSVCASTLPMVNRLTSELKKGVGRKHHAAPASKIFKESSAVFPLVLHLLSSSTLRPQLLSRGFVTDLAHSLVVCEQVAFDGVDKWRQTLFSATEALAQDVPILLSHADLHIGLTLPALLSLVSSQNGDIRFIALKIFADIVILFLSEPLIYDPSPNAPDTVAVTTKQLNEFLVSNLMSTKCKQILGDRDPIPQYGLKVLSCMVDVNPAFVAVLHRLGLTSKVIGMMMTGGGSGGSGGSGGGSGNGSGGGAAASSSEHAVNLVKRVVESKDVDKEFVYSMGIVERVVTLISFAFHEGMDTLLETVLDIAYELLFAASQVLLRSSLSGSSGRDTGSDKVFDEKEMSLMQRCMEANKGLVSAPIIDILVQLMSAAGSVVADDTDAMRLCDKAVQCLMLMAQLYPAYHPIIFTTSNLATMTPLLCDRRYSSSQKRVLKTLLWAVGNDPNSAQQLFDQGNQKHNNVGFSQAIANLSQAATDPSIRELAEQRLMEAHERERSRREVAMRAINAEREHTQRTLQQQQQQPGMRSPSSSTISVVSPSLSSSSTASPHSPPALPAGSSSSSSSSSSASASTSISCAPSHYLCQSVLKSSWVSKTLIAPHLTGAGAGDEQSPLYVIFAKENVLSVHSTSAEAELEQLCEVNMFATIKDVTVLPYNHKYRHQLTAKDSGRRDLIVVLSDSGNLSFLYYDDSLRTLQATAILAIASPGFHRLEVSQFLCTSPHHHVLAVSALSSMVALFAITAEQPYFIGQRHDVQFAETDLIWGVTFIDMASLSSASSSSSSSSSSRSLFPSPGSLPPFRVVVGLTSSASKQARLEIIDGTFNDRAELTTTRGTVGLHVVAVPNAPRYVLTIEEEQAVLIDLHDKVSPGSAATVGTPSWFANQANERRLYSMTGRAPLITAVTPLRNQLVVVTEAGDVYAMQFSIPSSSPFISASSSSSASVVSLSFRYLGLANPCNSVAHFTIADPDQEEEHDIRPESVSPSLPHSTQSTRENHFRMDVEARSEGEFESVVVSGKRVQDVLVLPGNNSDGMVAIIQWGRVSSLAKLVDLSNVSPILDFDLGDYYGEHQNQIFACGGRFENGSIRIIRNGVEATNLSTSDPDFGGVVGVLPLRPWRVARDTVLVFSWVKNTRVMVHTDSGVEEGSDGSGLVLSSKTVAIGYSADDQFIIQVHTDGVRVVAADAFVAGVATATAKSDLQQPPPHPLAEWNLDNAGGIGIASIYGCFVLLSLSRDNSVVLLQLVAAPSTSNASLIEIARVKLISDICCAAILPFPVTALSMLSSTSAYPKSSPLRIPRSTKSDVFASPQSVACSPVSSVSASSAIVSSHFSSNPADYLFLVGTHSSTLQLLRCTTPTPSVPALSPLISAATDGTSPLAPIVLSRSASSPLPSPLMTSIQHQIATALPPPPPLAPLSSSQSHSAGASRMLDFDISSSINAFSSSLSALPIPTSLPNVTSASNSSVFSVTAAASASSSSLLGSCSSSSTSSFASSNSGSYSPSSSPFQLYVVHLIDLHQYSSEDISIPESILAYDCISADYVAPSAAPTGAATTAPPVPVSVVLSASFTAPPSVPSASPASPPSSFAPSYAPADLARKPAVSSGSSDPISHYLLIGLRDGTLLRFELNWAGCNLHSLSGLLVQPPEARRLGVEPVQLVSVPVPVSETAAAAPVTSPTATAAASVSAPLPPPFSSGSASISPFSYRSVLALSNRSWVLHTVPHRTVSRLQCSPLSYAPFTHAAPFAVSSNPEAIACIANNSLHIITLNQKRKLTTVKHRIGKTPRRIVYHPGRRKLVVLCSDHTNRGKKSFACVLDPISGHATDQIKFQPTETALSLIKWDVVTDLGPASINAPQPTSTPTLTPTVTRSPNPHRLHKQTYICIGSAFDLQGVNCRRGCLYLFTIDDVMVAGTQAAMAASRMIHQMPLGRQATGTRVGTETGIGTVGSVRRASNQSRSVKEIGTGLNDMETESWTSLRSKRDPRQSVSTLFLDDDGTDDQRTKQSHTAPEMMRSRFTKVAEISLPGMVYALCPYMDRYVLASCGNDVNLLSFIDNEFQQLATVRLRFPVTSISSSWTRIAVSDQKDGVTLFSLAITSTGQYKFTLLKSDYPRLMRDALLVSESECVGVDKFGTLFMLNGRPAQPINEDQPFGKFDSPQFTSALSSSSTLSGGSGSGSASGSSSMAATYDNKTWALDCVYNLGETPARICKGSLMHRGVRPMSLSSPSHSSMAATPLSLTEAQPPPSDGQFGTGDTDISSSNNNNNNNDHDNSCDALVVATLLGSVYVLVKLTPIEAELCAELERRMATFPKTIPLSGNHHTVYRTDMPPSHLPGMPVTGSIIDGDLVLSFLTLPPLVQDQLFATCTFKLLQIHGHLAAIHKHYQQQHHASIHHGIVPPLQQHHHRSSSSPPTSVTGGTGASSLVSLDQLLSTLDGVANRIS